MSKGWIIENMKKIAIELSQQYEGNIQIQLDVNRANRICKIKITESMG